MMFYLNSNDVKESTLEKKFILWGHSLNDYHEMFDLTDEDLNKSIIEYGAGATSFNAEMTQMGHKVTSCDPMFRLGVEGMQSHVLKVFDDTVESMKANESKYNWKHYGDLESLLEKRKEGIQTFLEDFDKGKDSGRYRVVEEGKPLPFETFTYELALITHHLFVNFLDRGLEQHVELIEELLRVAGEVRIFPLLNKFGQVSELLGPVMKSLQQKQLGLEVRQVPSKLQKAGNAMLRIWVAKCEVTE